jgi:uncharacterized protein (DUF2236 family)
MGTSQDGDPKAREGHYLPDSTIWRVDRESAMMLGSGRALMMQASHPLAVAGVSKHSNFRDDPWDRLDRTMGAVWTVVYGSREDADQIGRRVQAMHARVSGRIPEKMGPFAAGTPYSALDPDLLLWVHATLVDTALTVYETWVRPLNDVERESYYQDTSLKARIFGTPDSVIPPTYADFQEYMRERLGSNEICVTEPAREVARWVMRPPLPLTLRPAWRWFNLVTVGLLPPRLRSEYGFRWTKRHELLFRSSRAVMRNLVLPLMPDRWRAIAPARDAERAIAAGESRVAMPAEAPDRARLRPAA